MISEIKIEDYLKLIEDIPIIDVRSPLEFLKGHIPISENIPLFSDEERAQVGTAYKQVSKDLAYELGYKFVGPKLKDFVNKSIDTAPNKEVAVHCWRGGFRSHAFAEHLVKNGFKKVYIIEGGYKSFRNHVLSSFDKEVQLYILGGFTGSGKTEILKHIKAEGQQVVDLEALANHKGSAFGSIGQKTQPTVEQFENELFWQWKDVDFEQPLWLEDEGHNIGLVRIPINLYYKMRSQQVIFIDIPKEERAKYLVEEYANGNDIALKESILKISTKLGDQNARLAIELLEQKKYYEVAMLTLNYYDKYYLKGLSARDNRKVSTIFLENTDHRSNAKLIIKHIEELKYE